MRRFYLFLWSLLAVAPAWAGCGPRGSDSSVVGILAGVLALFLLLGPCVGAGIGELLMMANGNRFRFSRVFWSIAFGACITAASGLGLGILFGSVALTAPVIGGFASLYKTSKMTGLHVEEPDGIGFQRTPE